MRETAEELTSPAFFPAESLSVRSARTFVSDELLMLGRPDLAATAVLAVSELATNAILHARSAFTVEVTALAAGQLRVSVTDASSAVPSVQAPRLGATLGRGLRLVAQTTDAWGVDRLSDEDEGGPGKVVWFELGSPRPVGPTATVNIDYEPPVPDLLTVPAVPPEALVEVRLLNTPLRLFTRETARHRELMREMALIALAGDETGAPVPVALAELAGELERYRGVGAATDAARDAAIARGEASIHLEYRLPRAVGPACARLNELLDAAEEYCVAENLLTLAGSPEGVAMRRWYLGEITSQIAGAPPTAWTGPLDE